jgi:hypothetical protein
VKLYDSRQPLECCEFRALNRQIGVLVTGPFRHHGLPGKPLFADLHYEIVSVNSAGFGSPKPVGELNLHVQTATARIISKLDDVIEELQQHRNRLAAELEGMTDSPPIDVDRLVAQFEEG